MKNFKKIALIPARAGSKRIQSKNIRLLNGRPLIAYAVQTALNSKIFDDVLVSSDSDEILKVAKNSGATVCLKRPEEYSGDQSPDIQWVQHALAQLKDQGREYEVAFILRPTNPTRSQEHILKAWDLFSQHESVHSLRAIRKCTEHPYKMWDVQSNGLIKPLFADRKLMGTDAHSNPYQNLPEVYVQCGFLEIVWTHVIQNMRSISGELVLPYIVDSLESFDLNSESDWAYLEFLVQSGRLKLAGLPNG